MKLAQETLTEHREPGVRSQSWLGWRDEGSIIILNPVHSLNQPPDNIVEVVIVDTEPDGPSPPGQPHKPALFWDTQPGSHHQGQASHWPNRSCYPATTD